jgi:hypothetical protein
MRYSGDLVLRFCEVAFCGANWVWEVGFLFLIALKTNIQTLHTCPLFFYVILPLPCR